MKCEGCKHQLVNYRVDLFDLDGLELVYHVMNDLYSLCPKKKANLEFPCPTLTVRLIEIFL